MRNLGSIIKLSWRTQLDIFRTIVLSLLLWWRSLNVWILLTFIAHLKGFMCLRVACSYLLFQVLLQNAEIICHYIHSCVPLGGCLIEGNVFVKSYLINCCFEPIPLFHKVTDLLWLCVVYPGQIMSSVCVEMISIKLSFIVNPSSILWYQHWTL